MTCKTCLLLLSEGLDLCVRARKLDAMELTSATLDLSSNPDEWINSGRYAEHAKFHNKNHPQTPILEMRCATPQLWVTDQYDKDLLEWETKVKHHLENHKD